MREGVVFESEFSFSEAEFNRGWVQPSREPIAHSVLSKATNEHVVLHGILCRRMDIHDTRKAEVITRSGRAKTNHRNQWPFCSANILYLHMLSSPSCSANRAIGQAMSANRAIGQPMRGASYIRRG